MHSIKAGAQLMMMGTAGDLPVAPTAAVVFVEDMHASDSHVVCPHACTNTLVSDAWQSVYTPGLENHGNTCYLNATLQCLFRVPELKSALIQAAKATSVRHVSMAAYHASAMCEHHALCVTVY